MPLLPPPISFPGVYVEEVPSSRVITGVPTGVAAFVGRTREGPVAVPTPVGSSKDFVQTFGDVSTLSPLGQAVLDFFDNGGTQAYVVRLHRPSDEAEGAPLTAADYTDPAAGFAAALDGLDLFDLLVIPPDAFGADPFAEVYDAASVYCETRRAVLVADGLGAWTTALDAGRYDEIDATALGLSGRAASFAAVYVPALKPREASAPSPRPTSGAAAGVIARTDTTSGVWTAPAGMSAILHGVEGPNALLTEEATGALNSRGINPVRTFPGIGTLIWGARTARGQTELGDEYRYINVRRLVNYVEVSLRRALRWVVFEPNDETLWARIRSDVSTFLHGLWNEGALAGPRPDDAYRVVCDASTNPEARVTAGVVTVMVSLATIRPAEYVQLVLELTTASGEGGPST